MKYPQLPEKDQTLLLPEEHKLSAFDKFKFNKDIPSRT